MLNVRPKRPTGSDYVWNVVSESWVERPVEVTDEDGFDEWGLPEEVAPSPLR